MDIKAFEGSPTGRLVRVSHPPTYYHTFIPNPLPKQLKDLRLSPELIRLQSEADLALGRLGGIGYLVPNPDFLVTPYTRLEAVNSSRIEGTQTSLSELFFFEAASENPPKIDSIEVSNYVTALNYGLQRLQSLPLSLRLIKEIHEKLMDGVRGGAANKTPGEFRRSPNWIGPAGAPLSEATYVPPPPEAMIELLSDLENFLHKQDFPVLVQSALMHYQFEAIHPFLDGNGRVGRLLITLLLCERNVLPYPLLYLSAYFEQHREEYYERLLRVSQKGDWHGWLKFFLTGVITQSRHAMESSRKIIDQREAFRQRLQAEKAAGSLLALLDSVFISPYITVNRAAERLAISYPTANNAIQRLVELGILEEVTGRQRNRIYMARKLLQLLVENEPIYEPPQA